MDVRVIELLGKGPGSMVVRQHCEVKDWGSGCLGNTAGLGTRGVVVWITLLGEGPGVWLYG